MQTTRPFFVFTAITTFLLASACSQQETPDAGSSPADEPVAADAAEPTALPRTASPEGASVFFISPADGDTVTSPVSIEFGIGGMSVVTAGDNQSQSGHHHLLVDTDLPDMTLPIPADENHIHFGDASTSTDLTLEPGEHTLRLLLGDHLHVPHDPPVISESITILVK